MSQQSSFHRIFTLIKRLNDGKTLNVSIVAEEFEVSDRTVRRDFELIKDVFGDFLHKEGENYKAINQSILNDVLSGSQLASLVSILDIFNQSGSKINLAPDVKKLIDKSRKVYNFRNKPFEELRNREVLSKLEKAIDYRQKISIKYRKFEKITMIDAKPYSIVFLNDNTYLACEVNNKYGFMLLRIGLIVDVDVHKETFYFNRQMEIFIQNIQTPYARFLPYKENEIVKVLVPLGISRHFKMKKFLPSQKIIETKDNGNLIITYEVSNLKEVHELMIKWVPQMKILSPLRLKEQIRDDMVRKIKSLDLPDRED